MPDNRTSNENTRSRLYLNICAPGDVVENVFVISNKQLAQAANGKYYIKALISDKTMQLNARIWSATQDQFKALPDNGFIKVRGRIENYQSNLQVIIEQMWAAPDGTFDVAELIPCTSRDVKEMCGKIIELCGSIQNRHVAALVQAYLDDEDLMGKFCKSPAASSFHHAYLGGLLEHTLNAMEVADAVVKFYPGLNRDLVLAGIFLHDIAKTWELSYESSFGYTDGGQLVGHIVKSAIWVEHMAKQAEETLGEPIPQNVINVLQHIIISHHGVPEFGAIKPPSTPEAIAVHFIENMDAKLMMSLCATRGEGVANADGNWTDYMRAFNGRLYRPDVAPSEVSETPPTEALPSNGKGDAPAPLKISNPLFETQPARSK